MAGAIAVAGATGFTGGLVADALVARGTPVVLVARSAERLAARAASLPPSARAEERPVAAWDEAGLAAAFDGCAAVIACAGPFAVAGEPVVRAAVRARVPYCDSTGEQAFIRFVYDTLDVPGRAAGIGLVPAVGFDYVPGSLGCAIAAAGLGPLASLEATYASESGATSAGTRRSMIEILAAPGFERIDGALRRTHVGRERRTVHTPFGTVTALSFPGGEAVMAPRHLEVRDVRSFIGARTVPKGLALVPLVERLVRVPAIRRFVKSRYAASGPEGPGDRSRARRFICRVVATPVQGAARTVTLEGRDPYGFTAAALVALADLLAERRTAGALAPAQAVADPAGFLAATGVEVRTT